MTFFSDLGFETAAERVPQYRTVLWPFFLSIQDGVASSVNQVLRAFLIHWFSLDQKGQGIISLSAHGCIRFQLKGVPDDFVACDSSEQPARVILSCCTDMEHKFSEFVENCQKVLLNGK